MQIVLGSVNDTLEIETSVAGSIHYDINYVDITASDVSNPIPSTGIITTLGTNQVVLAPAPSTTRKIDYVSVYNNGATNVVKLKKYISTVEYILFNVVLQNKETLRIVNDKVTILDISGREKQQNSEQNNIIGSSINIYKIGTAPKVAGAYYANFKDSGLPGAWGIGTPGLNGVNINNTFSGLLTVQDAVSGANYLRDVNISASVACGLRLVDLLWYNSGMVVTTLTAQAITQPTLPARDINGTTNGDGVFCAMYFSATSTNGAVANTTLQYTNSAGTAGRTATITSVNAAATVGQWVIFQLQAGDIGIRSIQSITLGTTYATGSISLFCFRVLNAISVLAINSGASASSQQSKNLDTRLYNGTAMALIQLASATTATTTDGAIYIVNK